MGTFGTCSGTCSGMLGTGTGSDVEGAGLKMISLDEVVEGTGSGLEDCSGLNSWNEDLRELYWN